MNYFKIPKLGRASKPDALMDTNHPGKRSDLPVEAQEAVQQTESLVQQVMGNIYHSGMAEKIRYGWKDQLPALLGRLRKRVTSIIESEPMSVEATVEGVGKKVRDCISAMTLADFQDRKQGYVTRSAQAIESLQALANTREEALEVSEDQTSVVVQTTRLLEDRKPALSGLLEDQRRQEEVPSHSGPLPAVIELRTAVSEEKEREPVPSREIVLTDLHGNIKALDNILVQEGVLNKKGKLHKKIKSGAKRVQIDITGDIVNKKEKKHPILDRLMILQEWSEKNEGFEFSATLGNHDLEVMAKHEKSGSKKSGLTDAQFELLRDRVDFIRIDETGEDPVRIYYHNPDFALWLLEKLKKLRSNGQDLNTINQVLREEMDQVKNTSRKRRWLNDILFETKNQRQKPKKYYTKRVKSEIEAGFKELFGSREVHLFAGHLPVKQHEVVAVGDHLKILCGDTGVFKTGKPKVASGIVRDQMGKRGQLRVVSSKKDASSSAIESLQSANEESAFWRAAA